MQVSGSSPRTDLTGTTRKKLVLVVIDGLTPEALEPGSPAGRLPALAALSEAGWSGRGDERLPVGDAGLPHVDRDRRLSGRPPHPAPRLVPPRRGAGDRVRVVVPGHARGRGAAGDPRLDLRHERRAPRARGDHGLRGARGRGARAGARSTSPATAAAPATRSSCRRSRARNRWYEAVYGPTHFFFFNLFESDATGAPLAIRSRVDGSDRRRTRRRSAAGSSRATASTSSSSTCRTTTTPRTRPGPTARLDALERTDGALGAAARGRRRPRRVPRALRGRRLAPTTGRRAVERGSRGSRTSFPAGPRRTCSRSRRTAPAWSTGCRAAGSSARELAERLDESPAADVVLFREDGVAVARRDGEELRFAPEGEDWRLEGDAGVLDPDRYPNGVERAWHAAVAPTAGDVLVSAADGLGARRRRRPPPRRRRQPRLPASRATPTCR